MTSQTAKGVERVKTRGVGRVKTLARGVGGSRHWPGQGSVERLNSPHLFPL